MSYRSRGRSQVGGVADQVTHVGDAETSGLVGGELDDDGVEVDAVDQRGGRHLGDDAGDVAAAAAEIENPRGVRDPGSSEQRSGARAQSGRQHAQPITAGSASVDDVVDAVVHRARQRRRAAVVHDVRTAASGS